ncbi:hypothetical protein [Luedemannella helvata]|uniref:DUF3887 domain-containing protein n=1 Tax=Luedemannella helvata TaxID=349315 RepID=A0ABN2L4N2_9ACTN
MTTEPSAPPGPAVPPPPRGPGVQPPFVAPPTDGVRKRRWIGIGLIAGVLALCCVGTVAGFTSLAVLGTRVIAQQEKTAVREYLTALQAEDYPEAYRLLCDRLRATQSLESFTAEQSAKPGIASFEVGAPAANSLEVPATVHYADGTDVSYNFQLEQNRKTAEFFVCGVTS